MVVKLYISQVSASNEVSLATILPQAKFNYTQRAAY